MNEPNDEAIHDAMFVWQLWSKIKGVPFNITDNKFFLRVHSLLFFQMIMVYWLFHLLLITDETVMKIFVLYFTTYDSLIKFIFRGGRKDFFLSR